MTRLEELTALLKTRRERPRIVRRRDSEIAQQLGITPAQLRRARYLHRAGRTADLEAEGLGQIPARLNR